LDGFSNPVSRDKSIVTGTILSLRLMITDSDEVRSKLSMTLSMLAESETMTPSTETISSPLRIPARLAALFAVTAAAMGRSESVRSIPK